jgi:hypothetical protein
MELATGTDADIVEGNYMKSFGGTVFAPIVDSDADGHADPGYLYNVACGFSSGGPANGSGNLFSIKFKANAVGTSELGIVDPWLYIGVSLADRPVFVNATVNVIPELPVSMLLPLFLTTTAIAIFAATMLRRRRLQIKIP